MTTIDRISVFETYREVCEKGGITEAAKALILTPATVQKRVRLLEGTYGSKLVKLTGGKKTWRMELTPAGVMMYTLARKLSDVSRGMHEKMAKYGANGDFTKYGANGDFTESPRREPETRA